MTEERAERQSSIKVSCNAKREYAFEVKIYFDESIRDTNNVIEKIEDAMNLLKVTFK